MALPSYSFRLSQHGLDLDTRGTHARGWTSACRAATTANIVISSALNAGDTIDGVTLDAGDRVLVKDQTTGSQNGIYVVGPTPVRAEDYDTEDKVLGTVVSIIEGTTNAGTSWRCTNTAAGIGTTALTFAAFGGGGGGGGTLSDVLAAGNDVDGQLIVGDDGGGNLAVLQMAGWAKLYGADMGAGDNGGYVEVYGGSGNGGAGGADLVIDGGYGDSTGGSVWAVAGGAKAGSNANGGDINLQPGAKQGTGRNGLVIIPLNRLPTSDPGVQGAIYRDGSGNLKVSL